MQTNTDKRVPASFWPRAAALLIDETILFLGLLFLRIPAWINMLSGGIFSTHVLFQHSLLAVICWVLEALYFVLMTALCGATVGKKALGLRVVTSSGEHPGFMTVLSRETFARYLSGILYIGYFLALADGRKQALHDMICDTQVVYAVPVSRAEVKSDSKALTVLQTDDPLRDWYKPYRF